MSAMQALKAHQSWQIGDVRVTNAVETTPITRQQVFAELADNPILVIGTHWAGAAAGRVKRSGNVFRLEC